MKKLLFAIALSAVTSAAFADPGTINWINTASTIVTTNATAIGGGVGPTSPALGGFIYGLFTAPYGTTSEDLTGPLWTFTGLYATNTWFATGGRLNGGGSIVEVPIGWEAGSTMSFMIAGWSSNLGQTWAAIEPQLVTEDWVNSSGFFGQSSIGFGEAGGGREFLPAFSLYGDVPNAQGTPLMSGFTLFSVVPEPSTLALASAGAAVLLIFRRRR